MPWVQSELNFIMLRYADSNAFFYVKYVTVIHVFVTLTKSLDTFNIFPFDYIT